MDAVVPMMAGKAISPDGGRPEAGRLAGFCRVSTASVDDAPLSASAVSFGPVEGKSWQGTVATFTDGNAADSPGFVTQSDATATMLNTVVNAGGTVSVGALTDATISSTISNTTTASSGSSSSSNNGGLGNTGRVADYKGVPVLCAERDGYALALGRFALKRTPAGGGDATGRFTLVLRRTGSGWRIIHDHSS